MACLFCDNGKSFTTKEHIIPESLGNDDLILEKEVCDKCQNYLSQNENYILSRTPIGFWRTLYTTTTKRNKLPSVDFTKKDESKGAFPDSSKDHDNVQFQSHFDFTTELILSKSIDQYFKNDSNGQINYVITPRVIYEIGRFLGKVGLEIICHNNREEARLEAFNEIRKYVRQGSLKEIWPIFHTTEGDIKSLIECIKTEAYLEEKITCYSYHILRIDRYTVFNLKVGIDSWFICLNQQFPHPDITKFMGSRVKPLWYSKKQWTK